jgi:hypothetical protein
MDAKMCARISAASVTRCDERTQSTKTFMIQDRSSMSKRLISYETKTLIPISKPSHVSFESLHTPGVLYASRKGVSALWLSGSAPIYFGLFSTLQVRLSQLTYNYSTTISSMVVFSFFSSTPLPLCHSDWHQHSGWRNNSLMSPNR